MEIQILQENLLKNLTNLVRIISTKPQLPILQNLIISTEQTRVKIAATNMETSEICWLGAKVISEGGLCVPARLFIDFVSSLSPGTITLESKEGSLRVSGGGVNAQIPGIDVSEFPPLAQFVPEGAMEFETKAFIEALKMVLFSAATDEGRPMLTGIKMTQTEGQLVLASTDGYRLSLKKITVNSTETFDLVVPARALTEVVKIGHDAKNTTKTCKIGKTADGQLAFMYDDLEIFTRLIDGEFPKYEKIIPSTHTTMAKIDTASLLRAVKSASIFARDNANIIKMVVSPEGIEVSANTPQVGENRVEIEAAVEGEGGEMAFNSRFLQEFLTNFSEEEVVFQMTGSLNPGVFKPVGEESYLHIIMPVRIQG